MAERNTSRVWMIVLALIALTILAGCGSYAAASQKPTEVPQSVVLTADLTNLNQPPDFQPVNPTATSEGALFPTATPDGGVTNTNTTNENTSSVLQSVTPLKIPDDQVNIMLLGSDQRPYEGGFRTDVILMVSINLKSQTINMISFPRDLYVVLPGLYSDRINTAQARGGFPLLASTIEYNFGVRPDYYGMINLWGFQNLIDSLGGLNVQVGRTLSDHRTGYGTFTVNPGTVQMNGEMALWYVRSRYTTSDFDRTRRAQEVVIALARRLLSFDVVTKFPSLYEQFSGIIETNLPLSEITPLLPVADEFFSGQIGNYAVGPSHVTNWITPGGSQVLLPNRSAIRALLAAVLNAE